MTSVTRPASGEGSETIEIRAESGGSEWVIDVPENSKEVRLGRKKIKGEKPLQSGDELRIGDLKNKLRIRSHL